MHLLVESPHRISLMHGRKLFGIDLFKLFLSFLFPSLTCFYLVILLLCLIKHSHTTLRRNPVEELSVRCRDLYLTTHTHTHTHTYIHTYTRDTHPFLWLDSNPQSQQANCSRPTLYIARLPGSS
jgi:hypothetical protein